MSPKERDRLARLFAAVLPRSPDPAMPSMGEVDLDAFWPRFEAAAPRSLLLALRAAGLTVEVLLPRMSGLRGGFEAQEEATRARLLERAATLPALRDLLEILKLVACLAYFDDPRAQAGARRERPR